MIEGESFDLEDLELLEYIERRNKYVHNLRNNDLDDLDSVDFKSRYRFNKDTVEEILIQIKSKLESATRQNNALTAEEKNLAAIRFFAFGNHQINVGDMHRMSQPSTNRCINQVAKLLAELAPQYIYLPRSELERSEISQKFFNKFDFPNVYGALDCTLIKIESPGGDMAERFRSRKGTFALNVQTMSDPDLYVRNLVVRWPGSTHDSTVFDHSYFRAHLESAVPKKYNVLGDSGYPLRSYLLTPFLNPANANQIRYNAAQISARNVVERQYGVRKRRFSSIGTTLRCNLQNAQTVIVATAVLRNIAISQNDYYEEGDQPQDNEVINNNCSTRDGVCKRNAVVAAYFS